MNSSLTCPAHKDVDMNNSWTFCPFCSTPLVPQAVNSGPGLFEDFQLGPISLREIRKVTQHTTQFILSEN